jgi:hypothetical protein
MNAALERGRVAVEVSPVVAPDGDRPPMVLLQLPYGYLIVSPDDARRVGSMLIDTADEVEGIPPR